MVGYEYSKGRNKVVRCIPLKRFTMNVKAAILDWSKSIALMTLMAKRASHSTTWFSDMVDMVKNSW